MGTFYIKKGKDIKLKGAASKQLDDAPVPETVAIQPADFAGLKLGVMQTDVTKTFVLQKPSGHSQWLRFNATGPFHAYTQIITS